MYRFELNNIDSQSVSTEMLQVIENICDEFGLNNDFGIISTAMQQLIDLIEAHTHQAQDSYSMVFTVDSQRLIVSMQHKLAMPQFEKEVLQSESDEAMILDRLTDTIECLNEGREFCVAFDIHPQATAENDQLVQDRQLAFLEKRMEVKLSKELKH